MNLTQKIETRIKTRMKIPLGGDAATGN